MIVIGVIAVFVCSLLGKFVGDVKRVQVLQWSTLRSEEVLN